MLRPSCIYFVDCENVGLRHFRVEKNSKILLFCRKLDRPNFEFERYEKLKLCDYCSGKNALDFCLVTELGAKVRHYGRPCNVVVSRDKGFDNVVQYWGSLGFAIERLDMLPTRGVDSKILKGVTELPKDYHGYTLEEIQIEIYGDNFQQANLPNAEDVLSDETLQKEYDVIEFRGSFITVKKNTSYELYNILSIYRLLPNKKKRAVYNICNNSLIHIPLYFLDYKSVYTQLEKSLGSVCTSSQLDVLVTNICTLAVYEGMNFILGGLLYHNVYEC